MIAGVRTYENDIRLTIKIFFFSFLILLSQFLRAQDVNSYINLAEQYENAMNDEQAILKYHEALKIQPNNIYAVCKASELCSRIGARFKNDKTKQADYFSAAKKYARTALKLDPLNSEANFVMALVMGREAIEKGGKEKIMAVKDVKRFADLSIKYNPQNYKAWYILGKWYYEVSLLNYFEKMELITF